MLARLKRSEDSLHAIHVDRRLDLAFAVVSTRHEVLLPQTQLSTDAVLSASGSYLNA